MIVFGIDPGSRRTGWGVVRVSGSSVQHVDHGVIRQPDQDPLAQRLTRIFEELNQALAQHAPSTVCLETVFHQKSAQSALILGQARGVALLCATMQVRVVDELTPAEVKKAVTGRGRAEKEQVQEMVRALLGLSSLPPVDAADALAIAIAGATRKKWNERVQAVLTTSAGRGRKGSRPKGGAR